MSLLLLALASLATHSDSREVLTVAGNFSFNGLLANLAQYDFEAGVWLEKYEPGLYLYGASNGVVLDMASNRSDGSYDTAYLVGAFDSDAQTSQVAYCSVGEWSGTSFSKVGEGLCPRGVDSSVSTYIRSVVIGNDGDLFVGGSFHARVWNGNAFAFSDVFDLAIYNDANGWLPLVGNSQLLCITFASCFEGVYSLAWDADAEILYIGGIFDSLDTTLITPSLCQWTRIAGVTSFAGGALSNSPVNSVYPQVVSLAFESTTESLFVAGMFNFVNGSSCQNIAVWNRPSNLWTCLYQPLRSISVINTMHFNPTTFDLFLAGWASSESDWKGATWGSPYAVCKTNLATYITSHLQSIKAGVSLSTVQRRRLRHARRLLLSNHSTRAISWDWLPGFGGGNGPILRLLSVAETGWLFIGGAFNNYPSIVIWFSANSSTRPLKAASVLIGEVSALAIMNIPGSDPGTKGDKKAPSKSPVHELYVGISASILFLVVVSIAFIIGFRTKIEYEHVIADVEAFSTDDYAVDIDMSSISLSTLTGGRKSTIDIERCFQNAMRARHVKFHESLATIDSDDIHFSQIIGEGSYGRVWAGRWRNEPVAVKEFVFAQAALRGGSLQTSELIEEIIGEAGIMSLLKHPKILQLYGVSLTTQTIWIVSELCNRGSLRKVLNNRQFQLSFATKLSICLDIAEGLHYLHTRKSPIIHRDLKSHNIFINATSPGLFTAKIGDWGSARALALSGGIRTMTSGVGTTCWLAPEVIEYAHWSMESDVYAYGIILWEIYTRKEVFVGLNANQIIARVVKSDLRPDIPPDCPLQELMTQCWSQNPEERPSFKAIIQILQRLYNKEMEADTHIARNK